MQIGKRSKKLQTADEFSSQLGKHSGFQVEEAYKIIRTNLLFTLASAKNNVLLVSSAESGAGKSITCANMALSMAETGSNVLLVDADMRKPVQNRIFALPNQNGLSTILSGVVALDETKTTYKKTSLDIVTAGPTPPNPVELLSSTQMEMLLQKLSEQYDYIFIDTPPISVL